MGVVVVVLLKRKCDCFWLFLFYWREYLHKGSAPSSGSAVVEEKEWMRPVNGWG